MLSKKLLVNSTGALFDLLSKTGSREAIQASANYLSTAVYQIYRRLYRVSPGYTPDFFSVSPRHFDAGLADADMKCDLAELEDALAAHLKEKGTMPDMSHEALSQNYPVLYQSLYQLIHAAGERLNGLMAARHSK